MAVPSRVQSFQTFSRNVNLVFPPAMRNMWALFKKLSEGDCVSRSHSFVSIAGAATLVLPEARPLAVGINALWGVFSLFAMRRVPLKVEEIISELKRTQALIATHEAEQKEMLVEMQSKGERIEAEAGRCLKSIEDYRLVLSEAGKETKIFETRLNALELEIKKLLSQAQEIIQSAVQESQHVLTLVSEIKEVHENLGKKAEQNKKIDEEGIRSGISRCRDAHALSLSVHAKIIRLCDLMSSLTQAHNALISVQKMAFQRLAIERSRLEKFCSKQAESLRKQAEEGKLIAASAAVRAEKCQQAQALIKSNVSDLERLRQEVNRFYRNATLLLACSLGLCFFRIGGVKISLILSGGVIALTVAQFFRAEGGSKKCPPIPS